MKTKQSIYPKSFDLLFKITVQAAALLVLLLLFGIIISLIFSSWPSIKNFGFSFLWTQEWNISKNVFGGLIPIYGTLYTSLIALIIGVPVSFWIAVFLTELAPKWLKRPLGIAIELLAAIPSIVYGMWGLFFFAPIFSTYIQSPIIKIFEEIPILNTIFAGPNYGVGLLTAGIVLSIMIIPIISSVMRDVFEQTPSVMKESAYGLGATKWEIIRHVVVPHTKFGILSAITLGLGRALGETMAVTFIIGNSFNFSWSIFAPGNSITSVLTNEFAEASSELHSAALMELGLIVFVITLLVQYFSKKITKLVGI
ncbi:phosphate ABC transporter permease subunit PstC [Neisseriaceae bacterium PsAf]|nr:phosphate ABC transporter permease subunit PstC [Neisseriaceae bacterium PsAf]